MPPARRAVAVAHLFTRRALEPRTDAADEQASPPRTTMSFDTFDLLPALSALAMLALVVWNGVSTARTLAALRAERDAESLRAGESERRRDR